MITFCDHSTHFWWAYLHRCAHVWIMLKIRDDNCPKCSEYEGCGEHGILTWAPREDAPPRCTFSMEPVWAPEENDGQLVFNFKGHSVTYEA